MSKKIKPEKTVYAVLDLTTNKIEVFHTRLDMCSYLGVSESTFYYNWSRKSLFFIILGVFMVQEVIF